VQKQAPSIGRILVAIGFALSCFGLILFLWIAFGGPIPLKPTSYEITAYFPEATQLAAAVYGLAGPAVLRRQLDLLLAGRRGLWSVLGRGARFLFERKAPYRHEPDLVGRIGYRELNYAAVPDGKPLDPAIAFREFAIDTTEFEAEPFNLTDAMPKFSWPTVEFVVLK